MCRQFLVLWHLPPNSLASWINSWTKICMHTTTYTLVHAHKHTRMCWPAKVPGLESVGRKLSAGKCCDSQSVMHKLFWFHLLVPFMSVDLLYDTGLDAVNQWRWVPLYINNCQINQWYTKCYIQVKSQNSPNTINGIKIQLAIVF